ncbi:MAG: DNRLRE domain-containing protein [Candidatus Margulisbacteria bacterium]|nr:DNRLRE domain-containing protein [Candidatus Margulisiibacteriota bacterium]
MSSLAIAPTSVSMEVGSYEAFSATAHYTDGTTGSVFAAWSVSGGIGSVEVIAYTGRFHATAEGSGTVGVSYGGYSAYAAVTVTASQEQPGTLTTIEVSPAATSTEALQTLTFTAAGTDSTGESMSIEPAWLISGDAVGVFSSTGTIATLEATAEGYAIISCISGEVIGYSYVTIEGFVVEITVESDTYVDESNPAVSYEGSTLLKAGYIETSNKYFESYFRFSLASIPAGMTIESAALKVYPSTGSSTLQLRKLSAAFSASTCWNNKPATSTLILSQAFTSGSYNSLSDSVLAGEANSWYSGGNNYGWAIVQDGTENGTITFVSKEDGSYPPKLRITYNNR